MAYLKIKQIYAITLKRGEFKEKAEKNESFFSYPFGIG